MSNSVLPADRGTSALHAAMLIALFAIPVLATLQPVIDWDLWWHLRAGQWIVEHGAVPATDPFSSYGQGRPWVAYSWLFEVLVYAVYRRMGLTGVMLLTLALSLTISVTLYRLIARRQAHFLSAIILTALGVLALSVLFRPRPWLFSILFMTLTIDAITQRPFGRLPARAYCLPLVFMAWANLHIQFVIGLAALILSCIALVVDAQRRRESEPEPCPRAWKRLVLLTGLCAVATLVNPYGWAIYRVVWEYANQSVPFQFVAELSALDFRRATDYLVPLLGGAAAFALGRRQRLGTFEVILLLWAGLVAFRSRRDLWVVVIAASTILGATPLASAPPGMSLPLASVWRWLTAAAIAMLIGLVLVLRGLGEQRQLQERELVFPVQAARIVRNQGYSGPLYNDFSWGGYLIWALPELAVAIDGRTNLHGDERLLRFQDTWAGRPGWDRDEELAAAGLVIAPRTSPLAELLAHDDRFIEVPAGDPLARLFVARWQKSP